MGGVAFVFPGQGSQQVGMGKAAYEASEAARAVFDEADAALGERLSQLCFEGPEADLKLTANTQPALLATSIALLRALSEQPDMVAGHSLGEYSANVAAGTLSLADAIKLVRVRGTYMQEAVPVGKGAMAAVMGGELAAIEKVLAELPGVLEPANYNSPGQLVIAGEAEALTVAKPLLNALGCKVMPLAVSAPFHSSLMKPAQERLTPHLNAAAFLDPRMPICINADAELVSTGAAACDALIRQVSMPVRWQQSVQRMSRAGITLCVEIGHGKVLSGLIKRIDKDIVCVNVQSPADFDAAREAIRAARAS